MLKKKLLYTAVTRAKEYLIMLGSTEAIKLCTNRIETKRKTKLVEKIKSQFDEKFIYDTTLAEGFEDSLVFHNYHHFASDLNEKSNCLYGDWSISCCLH